MGCLPARTITTYINPTGNFNACLVIGTLEGIVLLYYLSDRKDRLLGKSLSGQMFGEVTAVAIRPDGEIAVALSSQGEILSFDVLTALKENAAD